MSRNDEKILAAIQDGRIQIDPHQGEVLGRATWVLNSGYLAFEVREGGERIRATVHRTVLLAKLGRPLREGFDAAHLNHNKLDNRASNLVEMSRLENIRENVKVGRNPHGAAHGRAHLTDAQVRKIRELAASGRLLQREIAERFGTSQPHVSAIHLGRYRSRP